MSKAFKLSEDGHTIIDFNPYAFKDDGVIVFPSEINGKSIKSIKMSFKTKTELNSLFASFDVVIENGIKNIDEKMFAETKIRSISIPASIETIPPSCFYESFRLEEVTFTGESQLKTIGQNAFFRCGELKSISLPSTLKVVGERAFKASSLEKIDFSNMVNGLEIGELAFAECGNLKKVILPKAKVNLQQYAFYYCQSLETVDMSESNIGSIKQGMFLNCISLKNAILPESVKTIGERAFCSCSSLETVGLSNTAVYELGLRAFKEASKYCDGKFPDTLRVIKEQCFYKCGLNSISFPAYGLDEIGDEVFSENPIKGEIDLRPLLSCEKIGHSVFAYTDVESVTLLPFFGEQAVCKYMFDCCKSLKKVNVVNDAILYEGMFNSCNNLKEVILPETLTIIPAYVFRKTTNLKKISFPDSLKLIEFAAFYDSGIENLDLSVADSVSINSSSFKGVKLKSIKLPFYGCEIKADAFEAYELKIIKENSPFAVIN